MWPRSSGKWRRKRKPTGHWDVPHSRPKKAKRDPQKADRGAADNSTANATSVDAADDPGPPAAPPASGSPSATKSVKFSSADPVPAPSDDAAREFVEQAELRRSTLLAARAARDQAATVHAVASSAAAQAATSVVNQLHAQAGMPPAAPPPPAVEEISPAVVAQEDAELALIDEQLRLYGR